MTAGEAIRAAAERLAAISDTARLDAEVLMAHAFAVSRSDLLLRHMRDPEPAGFAALVERRATSEPVAYIVGHQDFFGLTLAVSPAVLIPRGDSEVLVEAALAARPDAVRVLDCGTGSGALLLAVLANIPGAKGIGEKGAAELLRRHGSLEAAIAGAGRESKPTVRRARIEQAEEILVADDEARRQVQALEEGEARIPGQIDRQVGFHQGYRRARGSRPRREGFQARVERHAGGRPCVAGREADLVRQQHGTRADRTRRA